MGTSTKKEDRIALNVKRLFEKVMADHDLTITALSEVIGFSRQYTSGILRGYYGHSLGRSTIAALRKLYDKPSGFDDWLRACRL